MGAQIDNLRFLADYLLSFSVSTWTMSVVAAVSLVAGPHLTVSQVWSMAHFFSFSFFCIKSLICLEGKLYTPRRGNAILFCSTQQLPCLCHNS